MYTIDKQYINELIIEKSKFICLLIPIDNIDDVRQHLEEVKKEYKGATHYCYAYITKSNQKYSDDGEPNGTAGNPILNVLKSKNLENILAIVVRYFGGIKLGTGGLVRAYTKVISDCINTLNIIKKEIGIVLYITVSYENLNSLYMFLDQGSIIEKVFNENINLTVKITLEKYNSIKCKLKQICIKVDERENIFVGD